MVSYVVGDIQGCLQPLQQLLEKVRFDPAADRLICAGDLVNRGPQSLQTLRFLVSLGDSALAVLGNHDLHLLAIYYGQRPIKKDDSLDALLAAPDCEMLCQWLKNRPVLIENEEAGYLVTHAGIPHIWDRQTARQCAAELEAVLRGDGAENYFRFMAGNKPAQWHDELVGMDKLRIITNYFTRMRIINQNGRLELNYKGGLEAVPSPYFPWFNKRHASWQNDSFFFGHWSALAGQCPQTDVYALDTGCIWGGCLRLHCIESGEIFDQACPNYSKQAVQHG